MAFETAKTLELWRLKLQKSLIYGVWIEKFTIFALSK
jgi:hypothetical protein